jgi:uncharacterized protein (DUF2225 family)
MTRVGQQTFTCPNCQHDFVTEVLFSTSSAGLTSEFRRMALGMQPEPYDVHTCTTCGLSGWDTVFETGVSAGTAALLAERVTPLIADGPPPAWRRYEYAAWIAQWERSEDDEIGYLYLCAAWCADDRGLAEDEGAAYRRSAIEFYRKALDGDGLEGNQRAELTYLIGELHRRAGDPDGAHRWLEQVAGLVEADETGERLAALAQRQRTAPTDVI